MTQTGRIYNFEVRTLDNGNAGFLWDEKVKGEPEYGAYWELPAGVTRAGVLEFMTGYARDNKLGYDAADLAAVVNNAPDYFFSDNMILSFDDLLSIGRSGERFDGYSI